MAYVFDEDISPLMQIATNEDLDPLVMYIKKANLTENLTSSEEYIKYAPDHKKYSELIETEIKRFGGNSFLNFFRSTGPSYRTIVKDVADRFEVKYQSDSRVEDIEIGIVLNIMGGAWTRLDKNQKQQFINDLGFTGEMLKSIPKSLPFAALSGIIAASGYAAHVATITVANSLSTSIIGRGLSFATNSTLSRIVAGFGGPITWLITGVWTLLDLAGPAYRVTIPCVVHISFLRQQYMIEHCKECSGPITGNEKFCPNCGAKIE